MKSGSKKRTTGNRFSGLFKLLFITMLSLCTIILAVSCTGDVNTDDSNGAQQTSGTPGSESVTSSDEITSATTTSSGNVTEPAGLTSVKIGDIDISQYRIVYARSEFYRMSLMPQYKEYFPVWNFNKESAERLAEIILNACGVELDIVEDKSSDDEGYEILIGDTSRDAVDSLALSELASDSYKIATSSDKFVICGGEYGTTWHALDYIEELFENALSSEEKTLEFGKDFSYDGEYHLTRIGTIGDSITEGVGASSAAYFAYPAQLSRYLWKDALVYNFGNSGKTMRSDLTDAYTKTQTYTDVLNAAPELDIVTIMLGTNDSNRDRNWTALSTTAYKNSCKQIFAALYAKNNDLKFVLANCPAYFGSDGFGSKTVRDLQQELPEELNNLGYNTTFFDMYEVTSSMSSYFPDSLHPNDKGHMLMAQIFSEYLYTLINQESDEA